MKKTRGEAAQAPTPSPAMVTVQMPLPMLALMSGLRDDFQALCIDAGRQVLGAMMEHERTVLCGPKWPSVDTSKPVLGVHRGRPLALLEAGICRSV